MTDTIRKDYEAEFPKPDFLEWEEKLQAYLITVGVTVQLIDELHSYSDGLRKWQAAHARYAPRWISVEDDKPKPRQRVLVLTTNADGCPHITTATWNASAGFLGGGGYRDKDVTHWMPLPQLIATKEPQ